MGCSLPPFCWRRQPVDLVGVLIAKGAMVFTNHFAAYRRGQHGLLGELYSGQLAGEYRAVQRRLLSSPRTYHQRPITFSAKHGLSALLIRPFYRVCQNAAARHCRHIRPE